MIQNGKSPLAKLWNEAEPIASHAFVVLILEASLLLIGAGTYLLKSLLPDQKEHLAQVELIDSWIALALLCMFGLYTILQVGLRLARALLGEWARKGDAAVPGADQ